MFCCLKKSIRHIPATNRFTYDDVLSLQYFNANQALFGTSSGKLYLHDFLNQQTIFVCDVKQLIKSISSYMMECLFGTEDGQIYLIPSYQLSFDKKKNYAPILISQMNSAITRLFIFGDGQSKFLYTASGQNKLNGYLLNRIRSSFSQGITLGDQLQQLAGTKRVALKQPGLAIDESPQSTSTSKFQTKTPHKEDSSQMTSNDVGDDNNLEQIQPITPVFTIDFSDVLPTFLHGAGNIFAFCGYDGNVRFFNQMSSNPETHQFFLGRSFPVCCQMHFRESHGQSQLFCEIGYQNGEAVSYNVLKKEFKELQFYKNAQQAVVKKSLFGINKFDKKGKYISNVQEMSVHSAGQGMRLKQNNVNDLLKIIEVQDEVDVVREVELSNDKFQHKLINDLINVTFQGGVRAIWMFENKLYVAVADDTNIYLFQRIQINGKENCYYLANQLQFTDDIVPNRLEFSEYNQSVFCMVVLLVVE